ncbi:unnamed protein product [Malus baccata var. baccata]
MGNHQAKPQASCKQYEFPASTAPNASLPSHDHTRNSNSNQVKLTNLSGAEAAQTGMARVHKVQMRREDNDDAFSDFINRTKFKNRATTSNAGIEKAASAADGVYETKQEDNAYDMFTDFVNRSKSKIRKTFSIRSNTSFKNSLNPIYRLATVPTQVSVLETSKTEAKMTSPTRFSLGRVEKLSTVQTRATTYRTVSLTYNDALSDDIHRA